MEETFSAALLWHRGACGDERQQRPVWLEQGEPGGVVEMAEAISGEQNIWGLPQADILLLSPEQ